MSYELRAVLFFIPCAVQKDEACTVSLIVTEVCSLYMLPSLGTQCEKASYPFILWGKCCCVPNHSSPCQD